MPIIGNVEGKSSGGRLLNLAIHAILILGAAAMICPFLAMLSGSVKSNVDFMSFDIVPRYFHDDPWLFKKFLVSKYNGKYDILFANLKDPAASIEDIAGPAHGSPKVCEDFSIFLKELKGDSFHTAGMMQDSGVSPLMAREFRSWLKSQYGGGSDGLRKMNAELKSSFLTWDGVSARKEDRFSRRGAALSSQFDGKFLEFKRTAVPLYLKAYMDVDGWFMDYLRREVARSLPEINAELGTGWRNWGEIVASESIPYGSPTLAKVWQRFVREEVNLDYVAISPEGVPAYHEFLRSKYKDDIAVLNNAYGDSYKSFADLPLLQGAIKAGHQRDDWNDFISQAAPASSLKLDTLSQRYRKWIATKYTDAGTLNKAYSRGFGSFEDIPLLQSAPAGNIAWNSDWQEFADTLHEDQIGLSRKSIFDYRSFIGSSYKGKSGVDYQTMSSDYDSRIASGDEIPHYRNYPSNATTKAKGDYAKAVKSDGLKPLRSIWKPSRLQAEWAVFLKRKYADVSKLNEAYGLLYSSIDSISVPMKEWEWSQFKANKGGIFMEFLTRNYRMVLDTLFTNGRAALNTLIYCLLSIVAALTVNPMAAYALSRFRPPCTYKLLLFLMLTLAFPEMVIGIPQFLLTKELGLMNTYWALILPTMASGYSIFLLKGFFDGIPRELFEAAQMEGASEWHMFWTIAMSLSKPVLAVVALGAFVAAYGNFMLAFLVCQKQDMWTVMVYLYQLQQQASPAVGFAALAIAAIPTLLVFVFCQNLIMKGIVVPTEE